MSDYTVYWGETHDNTYQFVTHRAGHQPPHIVTAMQRASEHLDFYAAAYYMAEASAFQPGATWPRATSPTSSCSRAGNRRTGSTRNGPRYRRPPAP